MWSMPVNVTGFSCGLRTRAGASNPIPPNSYFLKLRTWATRALISSSLNPSAGFIRILPSLSLSPSLIFLMPEEQHGE